MLLVLLVRVHVYLVRAVRGVLHGGVATRCPDLRRGARGWAA